MPDSVKPKDSVRRFILGTRVRVLRTIHGTELGAGGVGTVVAKRWQDNAAWIRLDTRHENAEAHPHASTDTEHATDVLAFVDDCEDA